MKSANKAKKITAIISLVLAGIMLIMTFSGCGAEKNEDSDKSDKEKEVKVDITAAAEKLATDVTYYEELISADEDMAKSLLMLDEGITATKVAMYVGSGASADMFAITESETKEEADKVNAALTKYMDTQKKLYASYMPLEADKIGKSILTQKGNYNIICITADTDTANSVIKTLFGK